MTNGKQFLDLFEDRKRGDSADHQEVPSPSALDSSKVGTADGEARRRRQQHQTRAEQCAPRLLLGQEQQGKKERRTRPSPGRSVETTERHMKYRVTISTFWRHPKHDQQTAELTGEGNTIAEAVADATRGQP